MGERADIVSALLEMFKRRENDTPFAFYAEDIVWDSSQLPGLAGGGVYHGHEGVREFWGKWLEPWERIEWDYEISEREDEVVVDIANQRNLGRGSGVWVEQAPYQLVFGFRGNKVTSVELVWSAPAG